MLHNESLIGVVERERELEPVILGFKGTGAGTHQKGGTPRTLLKKLEHCTVGHLFSSVFILLIVLLLALTDA